MAVSMPVSKRVKKTSGRSVPWRGQPYSQAEWKAICSHYKGDVPANDDQKSAAVYFYKNHREKNIWQKILAIHTYRWYVLGGTFAYPNSPKLHNVANSATNKRKNSKKRH